LSKPKFAPVVYEALRDQGMSNRLIAKHLDVDEASVRRGLQGRDEDAPVRRFLVEVREVS